MGDLAESGTLGTFTPEQLFAGECEIVTDHALVADEKNLAKYTVVAKNAAGQLVAWNPGQADIAVAGGAVDQTTKAPETFAVGILAQPMDTTDATGTSEATNCPFFVGGYFNHAALVWPAAADTFAERVAAFERTNIRIGALL